MTTLSVPVSRPIGKALVVGSSSGRAAPLGILQQLGYQTGEADDPYAAMAELCRRPLVYRAVILSLASLYREELQMITALKRRLPHLEIWLAHSDGRAAALAEAMRLGADGLVAEDGLHRFAGGDQPTQTIAPPPADARPTPPKPAAPPAAAAPADAEPVDDENGEPVLTAEELRALLQDAPLRPGGEEK